MNGEYEEFQFDQPDKENDLIAEWELEIFMATAKNDKVASNDEITVGILKKGGYQI